MGQCLVDSSGNPQEIPLHAICRAQSAQIIDDLQLVRALATTGAAAWFNSRSWTVASASSVGASRQSPCKEDHPALGSACGQVTSNTWHNLCFVKLEPSAEGCIKHIQTQCGFHCAACLKGEGTTKHVVGSNEKTCHFSRGEP